MANFCRTAAGSQKIGVFFRQRQSRQQKIGILFCSGCAFTKN
jgi:hypothetical protein